MCFHTSKAEVEGWTGFHTIVWENWFIEKTKLETFLIPYPKERSIWVKDLKVKDKSIRLKEDDKGDYL